MDLDSLYLLVTEAIMRAEALQDLGAPGASSAFTDLSLIEEKIAKLLPPSDTEGAIARRGAVRAAAVGGDAARARQLVDRFAEEAGTTDDLRRQLNELLSTATPDTPKGDVAAPAVEATSASPTDRAAPRTQRIDRSAREDRRDVVDVQPPAQNDGRLRRWVDLQRVAAGMSPLGTSSEVPARAGDQALRVHVARETMEEMLSNSA